MKEPATVAGSYSMLDEQGERRAAVRILLQRPAPEHFGGGVLHVEKTGEYLRALRVEVDQTYELEPDLAEYDLVHLFNTPKTGELLVQCANAQRQRKPLVVSSIYWNAPRLLECFRADEPRAEAIERWWLFSNHLLSVVLGEADRVLTASAMEQGWLARDFGLTPERMRVVPLAAEPFFAAAEPEAFVQRCGVRDFVLCSAVLAPVKNQLRLLRALRDFPAPLVLVYTNAVAHYERRCRAEAGANVIFVGELDQSTLASAYAAAKVHAMVSFYEPTGLVTLEAGLAGCNLVCTADTPIVEYVGDQAQYADPLDVAAIRRAVEVAYSRPRNHVLSRELRDKFTWERAAQLTLSAYDGLLADRASLARRKGETRYRWLIAFHDRHERLRAVCAPAPPPVSPPTAAPPAPSPPPPAPPNWTRRLRHRLAATRPGRLLARLRDPGPPPIFTAPRGPALAALAPRASELKRVLIIAEAGAWHVRRAREDVARALPEAAVSLAADEAHLGRLRRELPDLPMIELTGSPSRAGIESCDAVIVVGEIGRRFVRLAERAGAKLLVQYNTTGYFAGSAVMATPAQWRRRLGLAAVRRPLMLALAWLLSRAYRGYFRLWDRLRRKEYVELTCLGCGAVGRAAVHWGPREDPAYATCPRCGLVQLSTSRSEAELTEIYEDAGAIRGYLNVRDEAATRARHEGILALTEKWRQPGRILDVGCADGRFLEAAHDNGWQVEGVESSALLAQMARQAIPEVTVYVGLIGAVALPRAHFDAINLCHVAEHVPDVPELFRKCYEAMKPGGVLCAVVPDIDSFGARATRDVDQRCIRRAAGHATLPTPKMTSAILRGQGFEVLETGTRASGRIHRSLWTSRLFGFLPAALRRLWERREPQLNEYLAEVGAGEEYYVIARKPTGSGRMSDGSG